MARPALRGPAVRALSRIEFDGWSVATPTTRLLIACLTLGKDALITACAAEHPLACRAEPFVIWVVNMTFGIDREVGTRSTVVVGRHREALTLDGIRHGPFTFSPKAADPGLGNR